MHPTVCAGVRARRRRDCVHTPNAPVESVLRPKTQCGRALRAFVWRGACCHSQQCRACGHSATGQAATQAAYTVPQKTCLIALIGTAVQQWSVQCCTVYSPPAAAVQHVEDRTRHPIRCCEPQCRKFPLTAVAVGASSGPVRFDSIVEGSARALCDDEVGVRLQRNNWTLQPTRHCSLTQGTVYQGTASSR